MEKKNKKKLVKMLLRTNLENIEEEELIDQLIDQPISMDVDKEDIANMKTGDKIADKLTEIVGSWYFIIVFILFLIIWILLNIFIFNNLDPFPFILLNLSLSCFAALQAPIILMSQNRQAKKDSLRNQNDYRIDLKSELIIEELHDHMLLIIANQKKIMKELDNKVDKE